MLMRIALGTALLVGAMVLPFLPGRHDPLAAPLSVAASVLAFGSVLVMPVAVTWLIAGRGYLPAKVALAVAAIVGAATGLLAAASGSLSVGAILFALAAIWLVDLWRRVRAAEAAGTPLPRGVPIALVLVPVAAVAARVTLVSAAAVWSRDRAIANAAPLIADIEAFRTRTGAYPTALGSVQPDYLPGIIGIERYRYEPHGEAYNLYFEPAPTDPATQEVVMYNPRGEQDFSSHANDLLVLPAGEIRRQRGHIAALDLPQPRWRRFLFD
jgi:hypothetical protein